MNAAAEALTFEAYESLEALRARLRATPLAFTRKELEALEAAHAGNGNVVCGDPSGTPPEGIEEDE